MKRRIGVNGINEDGKGAVENEQLTVDYQN